MTVRVSSQAGEQYRSVSVMTRAVSVRRGTSAWVAGAPPRTVSTSVWSRCSISGCRASRCSAQARTLAVVSVPARKKMRIVSLISASVMPRSPSSGSHAAIRAEQVAVVGALGTALSDDLVAGVAQAGTSAQVCAVASGRKPVQRRYQEHALVEAVEDSGYVVEELTEPGWGQRVGEQRGGRDLAGDRHRLGGNVDDLPLTPGPGHLVDA